MRRLDDGLVAPLVGAGPSPVIICPTGPLHALPWSGLPSCAERAVSVVPSLRRLAPEAGVVGAAGRRGGKVVLAAGPALLGALAELDALASVYPRGVTFDAHSSRVEDVLQALEGADVAHLACHGRLRADNPMFSRLDFADGPLTVFDLEKLDRPPELVVLAACDVGTAAVSAGDELLGLAAAFQRAGTRAVVASLVPVPDDAVVEMMVALHRSLAAGAPPAEALAAARRTLDRDDSPMALPLRCAFTCFGR
jgi:CHAT domain-containing protein